MNSVINNIKKNFTISPNQLINDNSMSDRARFLFIYMCSKPDEWTFYNYQLTKALGYTEDTLRKYLKELIENGWLVKEEQKRVSGKFTSNTYMLNHEPIRVLPSRKNTDTVKNRDGKNQTLSNKDYSNTKNNSNKDFYLKKNKKNKTTRGQIIK